MPLYVYKCETCGTVEEILMSRVVETLPCRQCRNVAFKQPTAPAMIYMKDEGGYPSRRKFFKGSAPNTTRATRVWGEHDPSTTKDYGFH